MEGSQNASNNEKRLQRAEIEINTPLSDERRQALEIEIAKTGEFFNTFGKRWFMAGGTGLELVSGNLTRDHQDIDIAMFPEDLVFLYDYAKNLGYEFERPLSPTEVANYQKTYGREPEITREDKNHQRTWVKIKNGKELSQGHNAFANPTRSNVPLENGFEVIALHKDEKTGGTVFGADSEIIFPAEIYDNPPKYTAVNGQEVPLTPKIVQLMYKVYEGRQKDFEDVKRTLTTMNEEEKNMLNHLLSKSGVEFILPNGEKTDNIDYLMFLASRETVQDNEKLLKEAEVSFNQGIDTIYSSAIDSADREDFYKKIEQAFGTAILKDRASQLAETADFVFGGEKPSRELFIDFAKKAYGYENYLKQRVKGSFLEISRWQTHKKIS